MKITDLSVTMINWKSERWRVGGHYSGGEKLLGVLTIQTDEGLEGHSFLGSSYQGAEACVGPLMEVAKPFIVGADPLDIGAIWHRLWKSSKNCWPWRYPFTVRRSFSAR